MKTKYSSSSRQGVALVIVLGLLAVLTILAVAFAISMRIERLAARNNANAVRAEHLINAGLVRVMEDIDNRMTGRVYPAFDATNSTGGVVYCLDLLSGEASNSIPQSLMAAAKSVEPNCLWITDQITNGQIAYLIVNTSGLIDANRAGGTTAAGAPYPRIFATNINELDLSNMPDIAGHDVAAFAAKRRNNRRYETVTEMAEMDSQLNDPVGNMFPFSFDVNRDQYFYLPGIGTPVIRQLAESTPTANARFYDQAGKQRFPLIDTRRPMPGLGQRNALLTAKFNVNDITNYVGYNRYWDYEAYKFDIGPDGFMKNYYDPLYNILVDCGIKESIAERPKDVIWNIVNYLDPDRVPQGGENRPYRHTEGGEAIPLFNEITFRCVDPPNNRYLLRMEIWYPFAPLPVKPSDNFFVIAAVYEGATYPPYMPEYVPGGADLMMPPFTKPNHTKAWTNELQNMEFGTPTEFVVLDWEFTTEQPISTNYFAFFNAQVRKKDFGTPEGDVVNAVDEAPGYDDPTDGDNQSGAVDYKRKMLPLGLDKPGVYYDLSIGVDYQVADPRSNGQVKYWVTEGDAWTQKVGGKDRLLSEGNTLGAVNDNFHPFQTGRSQGVPIHVKNGPMENIAEMGRIFRSNLDDEYPETYKDYYWWQTLNLMHKMEGAKLLDILTVRDPKNQTPMEGVFAINSRQREALNALFHNLPIGTTNTAMPVVTLRPQDVALIVDGFLATNGIVSYTDMFTEQGQFPGTPGFPAGGGGNAAGTGLADQIRKAVSNAYFAAGLTHLYAPFGPTDTYKEDPMFKITEIITFRQNIFTILLAAQVLGEQEPGASPPPRSVLAERRAVAVVYRDSYTGRYFVRSFKWLSD